ncbi:hypothetical protein Gotri_015813 [Gossypium trilobum]|uniref:CCHC-type domain-containing protein n=1 Tax=Gossypium trilobum TaxID=34281 RepID=A0A7J9E1C1_9ROSI|nr:hypothetical protein [Gossypium trilobum]
MDSLCENSLCQDTGAYNSSMEDLTPKKVRFGDKYDDVGKDMLIDSIVEPVLSWKDKLLGQSSKANRSGLEEGNDFNLMEGDIQKSIVNGIPSIDFSKRIHQFLIKDMENIVSSSPFQLMDIKNGYFLAKFQNKLDCEKVLTEGPWIIFGQYLIVQPCPSANHNYSPAWLCRGLDFWDFQATYINNSVSEIRILANGCFHCGRYGHVKEACPHKSTDPNTRKETSTSDSSLISKNMVIDRTGEKSESFGLWMLVEKKSQHKSRESRHLGTKNSIKNIEGSRFRALIDSDINEENNSTATNVTLRNQSNKGKEIVLGNSQGGRFMQQKLDESASGPQFDTSHNLGFKNTANQSKIKSMVNKTINRPESSTNKVASQDRINTGPTKTTGNGDLVIDDLLVENAEMTTGKRLAHSSGQPLMESLRGG